MLQMNHRNALWRRRRFRPYWVLPRPAESWFKINFNCRIISESIFFYRQLKWTKYIRSPLSNLTSFSSKGRYKKETVSNQKVLTIGIYRLSHGESFESAGVAMNVGKTKEIEAFMDVVDGLCELRNDYIKFPTTVAETTAASIATFTSLSNLPNIAGAIDGTHIKIKVPKDSAVDYFSRYQHDVVVQLSTEKGLSWMLQLGFREHVWCLSS